jgi:hypothetical protein
MRTWGRLGSEVHEVLAQALTWQMIKNGPGHRGIRHVFRQPMRHQPPQYELDAAALRATKAHVLDCLEAVRASRLRQLPRGRARAQAVRELLVVQ